MALFRVTTICTVEAGSFQEARSAGLTGTRESSEAKLLFEPVEARHEDVVVRFEFLDEGFSGDFDVEDETDEPLLRCSVGRTGNLQGTFGEQYESYCTLVNAAQVDRTKLQTCAEGVARDFHALGKRSWRRAGQELSRITTATVNGAK